MLWLFRFLIGLALALYVATVLLLGMVGDARRMLEVVGPWLTGLPILWLVGSVGLLLLLAALWIQRRRM